MKYVFITILIFSANVVYTQRDLKLLTDHADNILSMTGQSNGPKIQSAVVSSESGVTMDVGLVLKDFKRDKKYKLKGEILGKTKLKVREIEPTTIDISNSSTTAEMTFKFIASSTLTYTENKVESYFIRLTITELDARLSDWFGDTGLNDSTFLFECKKDWRVKSTNANNNVVLEIKLTPYMSAASIQQFSN